MIRILKSALPLAVAMFALVVFPAAAQRGGGGARGGGGGGGAARSSSRSSVSGGGASRGASAGTASRGGAGGAQRNTSVSNSGNRNTNINNSTNVNRNTNINVEVDDNDWDGGCCGDGELARAAAVTTAVAVTANAIGSIVYSVPPSCVPVSVSGITYQQCGSTWYQPSFNGTSTQYVVVAPP